MEKNAKKSMALFTIYGRKAVTQGQNLEPVF